MQTSRLSPPSNSINNQWVGEWARMRSRVLHRQCLSRRTNRGCVYCTDSIEKKKWAFPKKRKEKKKEKKSFNNLIHMFRGAKL